MNDDLPRATIENDITISSTASKQMLISNRNAVGRILFRQAVAYIAENVENKFGPGRSVELHAIEEPLECADFSKFTVTGKVLP